MATNTQIAAFNVALADAEIEVDAANKALALAQQRVTAAGQALVDAENALSDALEQTRNERKESK